MRQFVTLPESRSGNDDMRVVQASGIAFSAILMVIVLIAAIAITIALSVNSGNADSATQQARMNATILINQAQNLKNGFDTLVANGISPDVITFDNAPGTGLFNPALGGVPEQNVLPETALASGTPPSWFFWIYHGPGGEFKIMNIGTSAGNYAVDIVYLTDATCEQINYLLFGSTNIPHASESAPVNSDNPVDYSTDPATANKLEQCMSTVGGSNFYYKIIEVR